MDKLADLVLWKPSFFGAKPEMVIKGGVVAYANMGDPNASIPTPEPVIVSYVLGICSIANFMSNFVKSHFYNLYKKVNFINLKIEVLQLN